MLVSFTSLSPPQCVSRPSFAPPRSPHLLLFLSHSNLVFLPLGTPFSDAGRANFEVESGLTADVEVAHKKRQCLTITGGVAAALFAAIVIVAAVGGGGAWCYLQGPCASGGVTSAAGSTAAPSAVIGADMKSEFENSDTSSSDTSSSGRLRRRLGAFVKLSSGTEIDADKLIDAAVKSANTQTSFTEAIPQFIEGISAHLKTSEEFVSLGASDRAEIIEVTARTMMRSQVKEELGACRQWVKSVIKINALSTMAGGSVAGGSKPTITAATKANAVLKCKKDLIPKYNHDLSDVDAVNTANPEQKSFRENVQNISAVLAATDAGFATADDFILSVAKINKGMAEGFEPRADMSATDKILFEEMSQSELEGASSTLSLSLAHTHPHSSPPLSLPPLPCALSFTEGMGNCTEGMKALAYNTKLLGNSDKLVTALTTSTKEFTKQAIKTSATNKKSVPLEKIASGATLAVAGCGDNALPKADMEKVLKGNANEIIGQLSVGVDADGKCSFPLPTRTSLSLSPVSRTSSLTSPPPSLPLLRPSSLRRGTRHRDHVPADRRRDGGVL